MCAAWNASQITPDSYGRNVVAFTPNGSYLVGGFQQFVTGENWRGRIRFWSVASGEIVEEYAESGPTPHHGGVTRIEGDGCRHAAASIARCMGARRPPARRRAPTAALTEQ